MIGIQGGLPHPEADIAAAALAIDPATSAASEPQHQSKNTLLHPLDLIHADASQAGQARSSLAHCKSQLNEQAKDESHANWKRMVGDPIKTR